MKYMLTVLPFSRLRIGPVVGTGPITQYEVSGMPLGEEASIANFGSVHQESWRIFRVSHGVDSGWSGEYKTDDDALAMLQREVDSMSSRLP